MTDSGTDFATHPATATVELTVAEARTQDVGRALARLDPADLERLGLSVGDLLEVAGERTTVAKAVPAFPDDRGRDQVQLDGLTRGNAGASLGRKVRLRPVSHRPALRVRLEAVEDAPRKTELEHIASLIDGLALTSGDRIRVTLFGSRWLDFQVRSTEPSGPVLVQPDTVLELAGEAEGTGARRRGRSVASPKAATGMATRRVSYEDVGGLGRELQRIRELIELPLRHPRLFETLGIDPPKGVLLHGPPGCGKTLIARAIAHEAQARFFHLNGPEIVHRLYGESEARLRKIFEEAAKAGPSIIFLDEIDSIAPHRERVAGDVEKRVVAQLLGLMDGLKPRAEVVVIAATNLPNALDPALRRPGRFDREIALPVPDRPGRRHILAIHTRGMPLAGDVDLDHLAARTHGFVGADLAALAREAAMARLRRLLPELDLADDSGGWPWERISKLEVAMEDFSAAFREIEPSALREVFVDVPDLGWDDVGGLGEVRQRLEEAVVWPLRQPELYRRSGVRPPRGILLAGPPGTGKTLVAKAAARQSGVNFISVQGAALLSKYVGESERAVREIFAKARLAAPVILFLDEIDALVPARRGGTGDAGSRVPERVLSQFLTEMDGVEELHGVLVLAATNRPELLDPALLRPGRFDDIVDLPLPDAAARRAILEIHLRGKPVAEDLRLEPLAEGAAGLSGAELAWAINEAALNALRRVLPKAIGAEVPEVPEEGQPRIHQNDLHEALIAARESVHRRRPGGNP